MKKRVLFVCTHNSARSQMAEGYLNTRYGDRYQAFSAGTAPGTLNPHAIRAMAEIGIDISGHRSKDLGEFDEQEMDLLVAVCEGGLCPFFPWAKEEIHQEFPDPSRLTGTDEEIMAGVRRIRDEITGWIDATFGGV
ncbi:arsenate reductase ArsC [Methanoculleus oceani]|uniref:Low molecular weight phosphatase family protein n=1 Tax=Methanoculleus oceani TaxID=2184756 RepID=A0ABD4T9Y7_9EURY|nr:arsenate reductase ArsC [Methanoculleus sp. CWC-02]MCM2465117.1 low molecular weight phosphatase family protein [Methanoculleus sp. CWC-02]